MQTKVGSYSKDIPLPPKETTENPNGWQPYVHSFPLHAAQDRIVPPEESPELGPNGTKGKLLQ